MLSHLSPPRIPNNYMICLKLAGSWVHNCICSQMYIGGTHLQKCLFTQYCTGVSPLSSFHWWKLQSGICLVSGAMWRFLWCLKPIMSFVTLHSTTLQSPTSAKQPMERRHHNIYNVHTSTGTVIPFMLRCKTNCTIISFLNFFTSLLIAVIACFSVAICSWICHLNKHK